MRGGLVVLRWWMLGLMCLTWVGTPDTEVPPALPPDEALAARLSTDAGEGFRIKETDHFTIAYDTDPQVLQAMVGRLEGTYLSVWRYCVSLGVPIEPPDARLEVILFDGHADYEAHVARLGFSVGGAAGIYHYGTNRAYFANALNRPGFREVSSRVDRLREQIRDQKGSGGSGSRVQRERLRQEVLFLDAQLERAVEQYNRMTLQHEAAHQILFNCGLHVRGGQNPTWLAEGLATQFEVPQSRTKHGGVRVNQVRYADFRDAFEVEPTAKRLPEDHARRAWETGHFVPVRDLIGQSDLFQRSDENLIFRYAEAWGLLFYLQRRHTEELASYVHELSMREPTDRVSADAELALFEKHFGTVDDEFEAAWIDYMFRQRFDRRAAGR